MNNINESLSHHGILGMKWGIRRYQNKDGSLTPAGRRKAQKIKKEYKILTGKKLKGKIPNEDPSKKSVRDLTDFELTNRIKRLENEKRALSLEADLSSKGKKIIRSVAKDVLAPAAIEAGKSTLQKVFYNGMSKALGLDKNEVKDSFQELKKATETAEYKERKLRAEKSFNDMKKQIEIESLREREKLKDNEFI